MSLLPLHLSIRTEVLAELAETPVAALGLIVENGTGRPDANTYVTLEQAKQYFIGRRLHSSAWTAATTAQKQTALRQASMLLDAEFTWGGLPLKEDQGLSWPRVNAFDRNGRRRDGEVPKEVKSATCELAFYLLQEERLLARQGVGLKRLRVDVIEFEYSEKGGTSPETFPSYVARMVHGLGQAVRGRRTMVTAKLWRT